MSYTKTTWEDLPSTNTPINATRLNNIENGIKNNANVNCYRLRCNGITSNCRNAINASIM